MFYDNNFYAMVKWNDLNITNCKRILWLWLLQFLAKKIRVPFWLLFYSPKKKRQFLECAYSTKNRRQRRRQRIFDASAYISKVKNRQLVFFSILFSENIIFFILLIGIWNKYLIFMFHMYVTLRSLYNMYESRSRIDFRSLEGKTN